MSNHSESDEQARPMEPLGFCAVVEDTEGDRWFRQNHHWNHVSKDGLTYTHSHTPWAEIGAVRVLSEGVVES